VDTHLLFMVKQMTRLDQSEIDAINGVEWHSTRASFIYAAAAENGFKCSEAGAPDSLNAVRCWCLEQGINVVGTIMESFNEDGANLMVESLDFKSQAAAELLIGRWAIDGITRTGPDGFDAICEIRPENIGPFLAEINALFHEQSITVRVF
jgi:hypothetical protein